MTVECRDSDISGHDATDDDAGGLSTLRWGVAAAVVIAVHGGAVWFLSGREPEETSGLEQSAVTIELAPLAVSDAPQPETALEPQAMEQQPDPAPEDPVKPDIRPEAEEAQATPVEEVQPSPAPPTQPQDQRFALPETMEAQDALAVPLPQPKTEKKLSPVAETIGRKKQIESRKTGTPQRSAQPRPQTQGAGAAAAPAASSGQASARSQASWRGSLNAHLNRYKRFPAGAEAGGIAQITFTIDRSGRVLSSRLARSSGNHALDAEAVSLARRASPVPAPPPGVGGGTLTITVPIRFDH